MPQARRSVVVASFVASVWCGASAAAAQSTIFTPVQPGAPQMPPAGGRPGQPPNASADLPPGTATLRGRVFGADTGQPLRKAQVRVTQIDQTANRENKLVTTNAQGVFEFKELRAGRYNLSASKGSYVSLQYGQTRPTEPGRPLEILDGQTIERVDFSLPRGGIISGRILDEYGEPLSEVNVSPQRFQYVMGQRRLVPAGRIAMSDDLGEFRIFGIPPGQYFVQATYRQSNPFGPEERTSYAPLFFPGTTDTASAQRITIGIGTEVSDVVMTMKPIKSVKITGIMFDSQGRPTNGMMMVTQASGGGFMTMGAQVRPDGTFTVNGLVPGEYLLRGQQMGRGPGDSEVALARVTVGTEDITDLQMAMSKPTAAHGRVVVDAAAAASLPPRLMLSVMPAQPMPMMGPMMMPTAVNDDLTFELRSTPGVFRVTLGPAAGWAIRTVRLNGIDVTDVGLEFKATEDINGVEVELTNKLTSISGLVANARGEPMKDYTTIVFSQDPSRWGVNPRYRGLGRPDQDGRFKISGLPPGEFYIVALDRIDSGEVDDPEFLERVKTKASTLSLNEGETKVVDLKLSTGS